MAAKKDITTALFQGEDLTLSWGATDVDLTGATVEFRMGVEGNEAIIDEACTVTDGAAGEFEITLAADQLALAPTKYWYETRRTSGAIRTLFYGVLDLKNSLFVSP